MLATAVLVLLVVLLVLLGLGSAAYCSGSPDEGVRVNSNPIVNGDATLIDSATNGLLYEVGPANARVQVLHVYGSPYEMGQAQGVLLKKEVREFVDKTFKYLDDMIVSSLDKYPISKFMKEMIVLKGMDAALDFTIKETQPFTPSYYYDELRGLADASGVDFDTLLRLNMFAELTKASCSFVGSYGSASENGKTYQVRALDYDTDGPFKDYPLITVYHPDKGNAFTIVGWPGSIGALTGMSEKKIGMSEIGVEYADDSFGQGTDNTPPEKVKGKPWMMVFRDTLQFTNNVNEAVSAIQNSNRTCNLILGVGDGNNKAVYGIEYSGYVAVPYNDANQLPVNDTWHPVVKDVVYNGMDWDCPGYNQKLGHQLGEYRSKISPEVLIRNILPTVQTGDVHSAIYDLEESIMYVSFMRKSTAPADEPQFAYERQWTALNLNDFFATARK